MKLFDTFFKKEVPNTYKPNSPMDIYHEYFVNDDGVFKVRVYRVGGELLEEVIGVKPTVDEAKEKAQKVVKDLIKKYKV